jgi:malate synthase
VRNGVVLDTGVTVDTNLVRDVLEGTRATLATEVPAEFLDPAVELFQRVALAEEFPDFLTLPAYERI